MDAKVRFFARCRNEKPEKNVLWIKKQHFFAKGIADSKEMSTFAPAIEKQAQV